jgi:transcriptional regulator with XRE-family HTH domain
MRRSYPRQPKNQQTPLGKLLKDARVKAGMSQAQLAETIGISRPYLSQLEHGVYPRPTLAVMSRITEVLDISAENLGAVTGYSIPASLPDFREYVYAKYGLPGEAIDRLSDYFEFILERYTDSKGKGA